MAAITLFLHAPATNISSERLLSPSESISSLRNRLEHLTGIPPTSQKISLYTSRTDDPSPSAPPRLVTPVRSEPASDEEDEITLMMLGVREGMGIKVEDTRPPDVARMYTDESLLKERFELTEEEYANRSGEWPDHRRVQQSTVPSAPSAHNVASTPSTRHPAPQIPSSPTSSVTRWAASTQTPSLQPRQKLPLSKSR
jgi:tubulin-folding cofactor B